jgi:hypothetical protein
VSQPALARMFLDPYKIMWESLSTSNLHFDPGQASIQRATLLYKQRHVIANGGGVSVININVCTIWEVSFCLVPGSMPLGQTHSVLCRPP